MRYFRVVTIPQGFAPEWVRKQWVGVTLPLAEGRYVEVNTNISLTVGQLAPEYVRGFSVQTDLAIEALYQAGRSEAADWWNRWFSVHPLTRWLRFLETECELTESPSRN